MAEAVTITLTQLNSEITVTDADLYSYLESVIDASANALLYVTLADMGNVFQFQTDASENVLTQFDELRFYTDKGRWMSNVMPGTNPANAMMNLNADAANPPKWGAPILSATSAGVSYPSNKMFVCHDFVRYLASKLFLTGYGADLFANEIELLREIRKDVSSNAWEVSSTSTAPISLALNKYDKTNGDATVMATDSAGNKFSGAQDDDELNLARVIMKILMTDNPQRFAELVDNQDTVQPFPFVIGDAFEFLLTLKPAAGQHNLTGVQEFGGRSYKITLKIADPEDATQINTPESIDEAIGGANKSSQTKNPV